MNFQEWNPHDILSSFQSKQDSPKRPSTPEVDFKNARNEVEGNGGNGIEINWDKYEISYDCPRCLKKIFKKPYNQGSQMMWANHFTPIFKEASHHNKGQSEDDETPLEHISTCAFYYFQSPVTKFDIEYLDAVEEKHLMQTLNPIEDFPHLQLLSKGAISFSSFSIIPNNFCTISFRKAKVPNVIETPHLEFRFFC